jgi:hypothetical protein
MSLVELSAIDHAFMHDSGDPSTFVMRLPYEVDVERLAGPFRETARACEGAAGVLVVRDNTGFIDLSRDACVIEERSAGGDTPLLDCAYMVKTELGLPLAHARITHLGKERGTAISFSLNHAVGDAYSTVMFMAAWAARARGELAPPFKCDRSILTNPAARTRDFEVRGIRMPHSGFTILPREEPKQRMRWHFEERLRSELGAVGSGLSFNDALCATLWKEDVARRAGDGDASFNFLVDFRRFRSNLGPLFFGNAVLVATVTRPAKEVLNASVVEVGQWIRQTLADAPGHIDAAVAELESARATLGTDFFKRLRGIYNHAYAVTNLSRMPHEALNFGGGPPVEFELGVPPQWCPSCAVLPGRDVDHVRIAAMVP